MIYGILSTIAFLIILPFWLVIGIFKPKLIVGFREKLGFYNVKCKVQSEKSDINTLGSLPFTLCFYGVSVGEVLAMENLIKKTRESFPQLNIVVMTGTKTGQEIAHKKLSETANFITYFPFDFPFCIKNMLSKIKPDAVFIMETELWPNFASVMNKKKIPFYIINARISDRTYKSYKKLSFIFGPILKKYTAIFPQSKQDSDKLISIGANSQTTKIMGNLKFDIKKPGVNELNFHKNPEDKIILAGSTHYGEEEIILDVFKELKNDIPNVKLIIAPRHPERNQKVFELIKTTRFNCSKRSEKADFSDNEIILLDTMGELGKFYSVCDVAFIGGSFPVQGGDNFSGKGVGGHNPLEATIFNKPAISGPSIHNFKDIYAILTNSFAGKIVKTKEDLLINLKELLTDEDLYKEATQACEVVFEENKGALGFVIKVLQSLV